ncbi:B3 domain-containing protein Os03g0120900-like [Phragmites australis]|uniref:B3 domain-containing protein Os03g0120900-like n=1 Tax=Phragmites australis TaxID=29695 RepID=UPI002D78BEEE|nr:B3 domain-containing protein Os03g0120900-like [Phragmites australis]
MRELAQQVVSRNDDIELRSVCWRTFADGFPNLFISNAQSICRQHVALLASFSLPSVIFEQLSIIYVLPKLFISSFTLILPFSPTGTSERMEDEGDVATAFTLARILSNIQISQGGPSSLVIFYIHALQTVTLQSTQGDAQISSQDELETYLSVTRPMEDDKAKAIARVMRTLNVDKLTVELFCATLTLCEWNVNAAAEDFDICRGNPQIPELSLKQKLVSQFNFVKEQLRHFFLPDVNSSAPIHARRKNDLKGPNLSNQPLHCNSTPVKHKLVDEHESCDLSHQQKRRLGKLQRGSLQTQTPRRSPRLAHLKNTCNSTNNIPKERSDAPEPSPALANQVKDRADKSCLLHEKQDNVLKGVRGGNNRFLISGLQET